MYYNRGEPDGQQNAHKSASLDSSRSNSSSSSISGVPCSRSTIGRNLFDSELIEQKLQQMTIQPLDEVTTECDQQIVASAKAFLDMAVSHYTDNCTSTSRCKCSVDACFFQ